MDMFDRDWDIAVELTFATGRERADDCRFHLVATRQHCERGVCEKSVACANGIDQILHKTVEDKETVQQLVISALTCEDAALSKLQDQQLAFGLVIQLRSQRSNP